MTKQNNAETIEIIQLMTRYFSSLDELKLDTEHLQTIFTQDAEITRPNGAVTVGPTAIGKTHKQNFAHFQATQHLLSNCEVNIDGDNAKVRTNLVAIHFWKDDKAKENSLDNAFTAGGVVKAQAKRTSKGWKITRIGNDVVWREGKGMREMLKVIKT